MFDTFLAFLPQTCNKGTLQGQTCDIKKQQTSPEMLITGFLKGDTKFNKRGKLLNYTLFKLFQLFCAMHTTKIIQTYVIYMYMI